ncbi:hypothetical protein BC828DRAFT_226332 [Blastocladiella britannica]|nr:hypothetical protein BC828DRAFT_226332 [Blastocladiella britannica]
MGGPWRNIVFGCERREKKNMIIDLAPKSHGTHMEERVHLEAMLPVAIQRQMLLEWIAGSRNSMTRNGFCSIIQLKSMRRQPSVVYHLFLPTKQFLAVSRLSSLHNLCHRLRRRLGGGRRSRLGLATTVEDGGSNNQHNGCTNGNRNGKPWEGF